VVNFYDRLLVARKVNFKRSRDEIEAKLPASLIANYKCIW